MKKGIALFDFDGTVTTKDSLLVFIRFVKGKRRFYTGMLMNLPFLLLFKLKLISNQKAKEKVLTWFFKGMAVEHFDRACEQFNQKVLPGIIRPAAMEEINKLKAEGFIIVIVSASPENWVHLWAGSIGAETIASQLEVRGGLVTGRLSGKNCHGIEKVRRIKERFKISEFVKVHAYGDSTGDQPMLRLAQTSFYKPFRH